MSWLTRMFFGSGNGNGGGGVIDSTHITPGFSRAMVLAGDPGGLTPNRPGSLTPYRSVPTIQKATTATLQESRNWRVKADELKAAAGWTKEAYEAAKQCEQAQAEINTAHFAYASEAAKSALATAKAVAGYGNTLQGLRGGYAAIAGKYDDATFRAEDRIRQTELEFYGILTGTSASTWEG